MKDKISFSDLRAKYNKNLLELEEIDKLNIDYNSIVNNRKAMIDNYQKIINSINPKNVKDFEMQSKEYMEKITVLEDEIRNDEIKSGRKAKLIAENKKIVEEAKERKEKLEKQVLEDYEKSKKDEEKNESKDVKDAQKELEGFKSQLVKMEEEEEKYPNKVKDSKYKEFLKNKIAEKEQFVNANSKKSAEEVRDSLLKEIREEYTVFKKGIAKEYRPEESKNPNPVLEKAKEERKIKKEKEKEKQEKEKQEKEKQEILKNEHKETLKDVEITVGCKGQIKYGSQVYKISDKTVKKAMHMKPDDVIGLLKENNLKMNEVGENAIREGLEAGTINEAVVAMITSANLMPETDRKTLLKAYLLDGMKAVKNVQPEKAKNSVNLIYDKDNLTKVSLLKRIFKREMDENEKYEMLKKANVAERYGIAKTKGTYKLNLKAKIINKLFKNEVKELPSADEIYEVASAYNEARDSKDFIKTLKQETKDFSKAQKTEIEELSESQEKQAAKSKKETPEEIR